MILGYLGILTFHGLCYHKHFGVRSTLERNLSNMGGMSFKFSMTVLDI